MVDWKQHNIPKKETSCYRSTEVSHPTKGCLSKRRWPTGREHQGNLPNHPAVLLSKDRGVERTGKRDVERNISGVYTRAERK